MLPLSTSYSMADVGISIGVAVIASYTMLELIERVMHSQGGRRHVWMALAAFAMGSGIWGMHFIGMLAYRMNLNLDYDPFRVGLSFVVAILFSYLAVRIVSRQQVSIWSFSIGALLQGAGICMMHFLGMAAMSAQVVIAYDPLLVGLAVLIGIGASFASLWLVYRQRVKVIYRNPLYRLAGSLFLGGAIAGMHYTAMAAIRSIDSRVEHPMRHWMEHSHLAYVVGVCSCATLVMFVCLSYVDRARALRDAQLSESRFHSLFLHNPDAILTLDLQGRVLEMNPATEKLFAGLYPKLVEQGFFACFEGEHLLTAERCFEQAKQHHTETFQATLFTHASKRTEMIHSWKFVPMIVRDSVAGIYAIGRDLTSSIELERSRSQAELQLQESEKRYRLIAENMSDLISLMDRDGRILYVSPSLQTMFGGDPEAVQGTSAFGFVREQERANIKQAFERVIRTKATQKAELHCWSKKAGWVPVEAHAMPVLNADGGIEHVLVVVRDITERKRTEELLRKSDRLAIAGQLAAGVAHEIRNPLTTIKGFTQWMQRSLGVETGFGSYFELMMAEFERVEAIIGEYLMLAKPQAGTGERKWQDITQLLSGVITLLETQAVMNNVQIMMLPSTDLPLVAINESKMKQVFSNILKNAIEAMPEGGPVVVQIKPHELGHLQISVIDRGCGIPEERLRQIGEPFYTTKERGTGLGLMVSFKIVQDHGGTIEVASQQDMGTTVTVSLPVAEAMAEQRMG